MTKNIGIWIDRRQAIIVHLGQKERVLRIESLVEEGNIHGGYGSATKYLAQNAVSETKMTARKKQQLSDFFQRVIKQVDAADALYICGPGEARKLFQKQVNEDPQLKYKVLAVEPADSMTENQIRALVRDFFQKYQKRGKS